MSSVFRRAWDVLRANVDGRLDQWEARAEGRHQSSTRHNPTDSGARDEPEASEDSKLARYYANLELPYGSDLKTVRESWKRLVRTYHPDLHGVDPDRQAVATELVKGLNHAYEQLRLHLQNKA